MCLHRLSFQPRGISTSDSLHVLKRQMSKITPSFLLLTFALLLWSISAGLSHYLAGGFVRKHAQDAASSSNASPAAESAEGSEDLQALRKNAAEHERDVEPQLALAYALLHSALDNSDASVLMESVQTFQKVLEI